MYINSHRIWLPLSLAWDFKWASPSENTPLQELKISIGAGWHSALSGLSSSQAQCRAAAASLQGSGSAPCKLEPSACPPLTGAFPLYWVNEMPVNQATVTGHPWSCAFLSIWKAHMLLLCTGEITGMGGAGWMLHRLQCIHHHLLLQPRGQRNNKVSPSTEGGGTIFS